MTILINILFLVAFFALLAWIFLKFSKLAKERNKSIVLYGVLGLISLLLGTYLGGLIEILLFSVKQGLLSSFIGFGSCFLTYQILKKI